MNKLQFRYVPPLKLAKIKISKRLVILSVTKVRKCYVSGDWHVNFGLMSKLEMRVTFNQ